MGEEAEIHDLPGERVIEIADPDRSRLLRPAQRQREPPPLVDEGVVRVDEVSFQDPDVAVKPARHAEREPLSFEPDGRAAVERREDVAEALFDRLPPVASLRRQLALFEREIAVQNGEADDTLVRREIEVRLGDNARVIIGPVLLGGEVGEDRRLGLRDDQEDVVVPAVAGQKRPAYAGDSLEELLHAARRHRLPAAVLVDVLDAVDDLEIPAGPRAEDVPRPDPPLLARRGGRRSQFASDVRARDLHLSGFGETDVDAGERDADGAVLVFAGGRHRDAAGCLRHPEAAREGDAAPLEEAEDRRLEESGRREPPREPPAGDLADRGGLLLRSAPRAGPPLAPLEELLPARRDADEPRRPDQTQAGEKRL